MRAVFALDSHCRGCLECDLQRLRIVLPPSVATITMLNAYRQARRCHRYREEVLPAKLQVELDYLEHRSLWSDLGIIAQTVAAVLHLRSDATR